MNELKYCKFCNKEKSIKEFCKSGLDIKNICRECQNKKQTQIYRNGKKAEILQQENKQLKDNWNELKEIIKKQQDYYSHFKDNRYRRFLSEFLNKMQEIEGSDSDE